MDDLGDRMKEYEGKESNRKLIPLLPILARIDGKCFSKFTQGMARPYDINMSTAMITTTKFLCENTQALCGYTQSDEITLLWHSNKYESQTVFNGRIMKLTSVLASTTTAYFNRILPDFIPSHKNRMALFDCRVWNVPNQTEAANTFLWRELDATKNAISMAARHYYSHNELLNKSGNEMQEMLHVKGINFNDYPDFFKMGTFVRKKKVSRSFSQQEIEALPEKHPARLDNSLVFDRISYCVENLPKLSSITNRTDVIFGVAEPTCYVKV